MRDKIIRKNRKLGEASEEVEEIRKEWDEEFEKGIKEL